MRKVILAIGGALTLLLVIIVVDIAHRSADTHEITHAVTQATEQATRQGTDPAADIAILEAFRGVLSDEQVRRVISVDIFQADNDGNPRVWDRYTPVSSDPCGWSPCPDPAGSDQVVYGTPADYPPCLRDNVLDETSGVDTLGIRVTYTGSPILWLRTDTGTESAYGRMEPSVFPTQPGASCVEDSQDPSS